jgi:hypothetical protein
MKNGGISYRRINMNNNQRMLSSGISVTEVSERSRSGYNPIFFILAVITLILSKLFRKRLIK